MPIVGAPSAPAGGTAVLTDGTFANANWVETLHPDHSFTGRCILTNGLLLFDIQQAQTRLARCYVWSTGLAVPAWQQFADLRYQDNAGLVSTLQQYTVLRIGQEESAVSLVASTSGGKAARINIRLQRGRFEARCDFTPLGEAHTGNLSLSMLLPATPKLIFNSSKTADVVLSEISPVTATDYGYGAAVLNSTLYPFIAGFLYQNRSVSMPFNAGNTSIIGLGDTTSLAVNNQRSYGIFAVPYGVSGSYSPAQLQAEAESGTLSGGFVSAADAGSSAGNAAKLPNTTVSGGIQVSTTVGVIPAGTYNCLVRLRFTSIASATACLSFGLYNTTTVAYSTASRTAQAPNSYAITYAWYLLGTPVTANGTDSFQFRATNTATMPTDVWVDEYALIPITNTANSGPQQIWQQFAYDRGVRMIRP